MPYIFGKIYPETSSSGLLNHRFKILIDLEGDNRSIDTMILELCTLREYLKSIKDSPASLELFIAANIVPEIYQNLELKPVILSKNISDRRQQILAMAENTGADVVATQNKKALVVDDEPEQNFVIGDFEETKRNAEIFARGHEVPWSFFLPTWNMPWTPFYAICDEFGRRTREEYNNFQNLKLNPETTELARSLLLNRTPNICYTRDKLLFLVQQRRYAKRLGWKRQDFRFEATYFLSYYYLLLWGGIDQLSRILNSVLKLGVKPKTDISISKLLFVDKIVSKNEELAKLYREKEFREWITQLGRNRHFTAHEGTMLLSPLVEAPLKEFSDEELDKELESDLQWQMMKSTLPPQIFEAYNAIRKQNLRLSKYKVITDDIMIIQEGENKYIFKPLLNVDWDFNNFKEITLKTLEALYKSLKN